MTREEMTTVAKIALTADSWCSTCQHGLFDLLRKAFPDQVETINAVWDQRDALETAVREKQSDWYETYEGEMPNILDLCNQQ